VHSPVDRLRCQFRVVHQRLESWAAASPQALSRYAERVVVEDLIVNGAIVGSTPLALSSWRGRTGLSRLPPLRVRCRREERWSETVEINIAELRNYARAVYATTDDYLSGFASASDQLTLRVLTALLLS
jgi:hypothetical protein